MTDYYMGIDQSYTKTAVVIVDDKGDVCYHTILTSNKEDNKFERAMDISSGITCTEILPVAIGIEGLPFGNIRGNVTRDLAGLQAIIVSDLILLGYRLDTSLHIFSPTTVKKRATGSGKATKLDMINSVPKPFHETVISTPATKGRDDLADAYWIAIMTKETHNG
jgi:Holliday junction resolvasome RuvABC endonuclease subunit